LNILTLGDGETLQLGFTIVEPNVAFQIEQVVFEPHDSGIPVRLSPTSVPTTYEFAHTNDAIQYFYRVTHDSWFTYNGNRIRLVWEKFVNTSTEMWWIVPISKNTGVPYYEVNLIRCGTTTQGGHGNDEPFITGSYSRDFVDGSNLGSTLGYPVRVLTDITPRIVSEEEFKANTDWYIPPQEWYNADHSYTMESGVCAEFFINNTAEKFTADNTIVSSVFGGSLKVTLLRNGTREIHYVPVQIETRNCAYNQ
jgi:hypothetical protein